MSKSPFRRINSGKFFGVQDKSFILVLERAKKIAIALYLLAGLFDDGSSEKSRLEELALDMASGFFVSENMDDKNKMFAVDSGLELVARALVLLDVLFGSGRITDMNYDMINGELRALHVQLEGKKKYLKGVLSVVGVSSGDEVNNVVGHADLDGLFEYDDIEGACDFGVPKGRVSDDDGGADAPTGEIGGLRREGRDSEESGILKSRFGAGGSEKENLNGADDDVKDEGANVGEKLTKKIKDRAKIKVELFEKIKSAGPVGVSASEIKGEFDEAGAKKVQRCIKELVEDGFVVKEGNGRATVYKVV